MPHQLRSPAASHPCAARRCRPTRAAHGQTRHTRTRRRTGPCRSADPPLEHGPAPMPTLRRVRAPSLPLERRPPPRAGAFTPRVCPWIGARAVRIEASPRDRSLARALAPSCQLGSLIASVPRIETRSVTARGVRRSARRGWPHGRACETISSRAPTRAERERAQRPWSAISKERLRRAREDRWPPAGARTSLRLSMPGGRHQS